MELNKKIIQKLDCNEIYELINSSIMDIYYSFSYVKMSIDEFYNLALSEIENSKIEYKNEMNYVEYIKKSIRKSLSEKVCKLLNGYSSFKLINEYINSKLSMTDNYSEALNQFNKLSLFFETYNYIPNPDIIIGLIKNNEIYLSFLEIIFNKHQKEILSGKIDKIFGNSILKSSIEMYCMVQGIEIQEDYLFQEGVDIEYEKIDGISFYLKEIGNNPLLTHEEEISLAYKVRKGDEKARKRFIESNLKLVVHVAKKYSGRGIDLLDLIQDGNLGLMTAVDRFNPDNGYKFSTYAFHWIRQAITRSICDKSRNIRIPVHLQEKIALCKKTIINLERELNRQPTIEEVANELDIEVAEVSRLLKLQNDTISFSTLIGENEDSELEIFLSSDEDSPEEIAIDSTIKGQIEKLLIDCNLTTREREVLIYRYGIGLSKKLTLEEIGEIYNLTRERIRQIEIKAFMKIRRSRHVKELAVYMQDPDESLKNIEEFRKEYRESNYARKVYLKKYSSQKEKEKKVKMPKKIKKIYEYFSRYTKEQVNQAISTLPDTDKEIILLRYGSDLENPVSKGLNRDQSSIFYGTILPKIKRNLSSQNSKTKNDKVNHYERKSEKNSKSVEPIKEKTGTRKLKTIYEYFNEYTKEEIEKVIASLPIKDQESVLNRYGGNLEVPVRVKLSKEEHEKFYGSVLPKIKRMLKRLRNEKNDSNITLEEVFDIENRIEIPIIQEEPILTDEEKIESEKLIPVNEENKQADIIQSTQSNNKITKEDCNKILELLRTPTFSQMMNVLTAKEAIIISLKLGYVDGKYFTTKQIAEFLGIEEIEVIESTKKVLLLYKDNINNYIDSLIDVVTDNEILLTLS